MTRCNAMQGDKLPVTVVVPVRNEENNLARCLERLDRFAEIVIIDSGSTDRTGEIAESFGVRVVQFHWDGKYPKKRNWFLLNHPPTQPWLFFLDADEFLDEGFCDDLQASVDGTDKNGFWVTYSNVFLGRELRHGLVQRKLAIFRVGKALYERIEEDCWSGLDMEIHEHPIVEGKVGEIKTPVEHRDFKGLSHFLTKHRDYAQWEARRYATLHSTSDAWAHFTPRQRFKYRHLTKWWYPSFYFLFTYVLKAGFIDGAPGFHYAYYKTWYFHTIRLMIQENI